MSEQTEQKTVPKFSIRAYPAPGFETRWRAGRKWGKAAVIVSLVDGKPGEGEISPLQFKALQEDPQIAITPLTEGGGAIAPAELAEAKAALAGMYKDLEATRADLAAKIEEQDKERHAFREKSEGDGAAILKLERQIEQLQAELAKKSKAK